MSGINNKLLNKIGSKGEFNAEACMNCGTCTAVCPQGNPELPRALFRKVVLGLTDEVDNSVELIFTCLLCRMCEKNCPAGVKITENMRVLRHYINEKVHKV